MRVDLLISCAVGAAVGFGVPEKIIRGLKKQNKAAPEAERQWRRFELCCDGAEKEELYALLDRLHLTRRELALIVSGLRIRPGYTLKDF